MFPNVRLILVITLASVLAIACSLGLFAVFRVNREPFTQLAHAGPPLQLVFTHAAFTPVAHASVTPLGVRFEIDETPAAASEVPNSYAAIMPAPAPPLPGEPVPADITEVAAAPAVAAIPAVMIGPDKNAAPSPSPDQSPPAVQATVDTTANREEAKPSVAVAVKAPVNLAEQPVQRRHVARRARPVATTTAQPAGQRTAQGATFAQGPENGITESGIGGQ